MDFTNSYGVRLLMPFSERGSTATRSTSSIPWLYLMLGLGWWLGKTEPACRANRRDAGRDLRRWRCSASNVIARREVASGLARAGRPADTRFMVTPVVVNPFRREVVIDRRRSLREGQSLVRSAAALPAGRIRHREGPRPARAAAGAAVAAGARLSALVAVSVRAGRSAARPAASGSTTIATPTSAPYGWSVGQASVSQ